MRAALAFVIPFALAACQTQQQRCEARAVQDLRIVNALIAETEETIRRGYGIQEVQTVRPVATFCWGGYGGYYDDGWGTAGGLCWGNQVFTTDEAVAVNLDEQRATLRSLQAKRQELEVQARAQLDACAAALPAQ
jgi:hypothetical protein